MPSYSEQMTSFIQQMKAAQLPEVVIRNFSHYYRKLWEGETGLIPEAELTPVVSVEDAEALPSRLERAGARNIHKTVIIKLNGGLGTSMGLKGAKSLLKIKDTYSFMDIIIRQSWCAEERMPVIFMNSFSTREDTLKTLKKYPEVWGKIPVDFLQHRIPKVNADDLSPVKWPDDPRHEWCPPGHGDIYTAMITSGVLDTLISAGYEYAFVSNADNLGAVVDPAILGYFISNGLSFMMEVADRTEGDKKGGHLAKWKSGRYLLREVAQCAPADMESFQDIERHRYFNTNNIWLDLRALKHVMERRNGLLDLPMIRNQKTVDPCDANSMRVIQLETAMGAAISTFYASGAIRVPRTRFAPVKTTNDLLAVRSDMYTLNRQYWVVPNPERRYKQPDIDLDSDYYKRIDAFERRFSFGPPSMLNCKSLKIKGDFNFGNQVKLEGEVALINGRNAPFDIKDQVRIQGRMQV